MRLAILILFALCLSCATGSTQSMNDENAALTPAPNNPAELGLVRWERDFSAALTKGKKSEKPILLLFQEVPG